MKIFDELESRGLIKQTTNKEKVRELLNSETPITFYIGFDPTADSLHVGHLLQLVTAKRLIHAGHSAVILMRNATAKIGDPSGKSSARPMMTDEEIERNTHALEKQIKSIMPEKIFFARNNNWIHTLNFMNFMKDVGVHFSINNMLRADCFKARLEHGLTFLEFSYMLLQGFDFFWLNKIWGLNLQIGGDDQWSNILGGIDFIRKKTGDEVFGLTLPLLINSDGTKMGKTERGTVWLDPEKTSPFDFFQFWRNIPDDKVDQCISFFTSIRETTLTDINSKKKFLAFEVTKLVHGEDTAQEALKRAEALFESQDLSQLVSFPIAEGTDILNLLVTWGMTKSRTDGRNLINNRGIVINDEVLTNPTTILTSNQFGKSIVLCKGKKHFHLFHFVEALTNE